MSNAWAICLEDRDSSSKGGIIPNVVASGIRGCLKVGIRKNLSLQDEPASHQLVGEVMAHQGLRVAGLRGWSATLGLRYCPDSYGRLQPRIIRNARKRDDATPRVG